MNERQQDWKSRVDQCITKSEYRQYDIKCFDSKISELVISLIEMEVKQLPQPVDDILIELFLNLREIIHDDLLGDAC